MIIEGIKDKKGYDIIVLNLQEIPHSPCSYFVICSANSVVQIKAIANSIQKLMMEKLNLNKWGNEGEGTDWYLLDYSNIVIHIFKKDIREKYKLEELWRDGIIQTIN